ncbi:uncharacterized, partial [Tachysurus ichikawai]
EMDLPWARFHPLVWRWTCPRARFGDGLALGQVPTSGMEMDLP